MKIGILGNVNLGYSWFYLTHKQGIERNGYELFELDYRSHNLRSLKQTLINAKCDIVYTHLTFHASINPIGLVLQMYREVNKAVGTKFIHTLNDARKSDRYMGDISDFVYMAFVGNRDCLDVCRKAWKIPVHLSPYSSLCYDEIAKPVKDLAFEVPVFTGSPGTHKDRKRFIQKLQSIMEIKTFHTQSGNDLRNRTPELSASAKCILGLCTGYDVDLYIDVRPFQYLGTGAFMIMRKFRNMDEIIPDDLYISFDSYSDNDAYFVKEQFEYWKDKDTTKIRKKAFDFIQQNHSCEIRIGEEIRLIQEEWE